jgi:hypothetical protein
MMTSQFWYNKLIRNQIWNSNGTPRRLRRISRNTVSPFKKLLGDPLAITFHDPDHSMEEDRQLTFGQSLQRRLIVVSHTKRGERTRIINARLMGRNERVIYEEG